MYTPGPNQITDSALLLEAMRRWPFAILIGPLADTNGASAPDATHLPLVVKDEGEFGLLEGHFALANSHWRELAGQEVLVVFQGAHSYVSPTLYADAVSVPTWNYIAIHARGRLSLVEDEQEKDELLLGMIRANEPPFAEKWRAMAEDFHRSMLGGIVGFRIPITRIEGKFKLSQNRIEVDRHTVEAAHAKGDDDQRELAGWMARLRGD